MESLYNLKIVELLEDSLAIYILFTPLESIVPQFEEK
jgi:hypothetical protein